MKKWLASLSVAMGVGAVAWGLPLGLRFAAWGARDTGLSAKDYIQDGLVAMWDGIENAGWGKHDPNATDYVDLINGIGAKNIIGTFSKEKNGTNFWVKAEWADNAFKLTANYQGGVINKSYTVSQSDFAKMGITEATMSNVTMEACVAWGGEVPYKNGYFTAEVVTVAGSCLVGNPSFYDYFFYLEPYMVRPYPAPLFSPNSGYWKGKIVTGSNVLNEMEWKSFCNGEQNGTTYSIKSYGSGSNIRRLLFQTGWRSPNKQWIYNQRIYNRKLTDEEVKHNYEVDKARFGTAVDAAE